MGIVKEAEWSSARRAASPEAGTPLSVYSASKVTGSKERDDRPALMRFPDTATIPLPSLAR